MKVAVLFHRLGPYHFARLKAAEKLCRLHVIEFSSVDDTYAWDVVAEEACFKRITLFTNGDVEKKSSFAIAAALKDAFAQIGPDVAAIPGWFGRPALLALALCRKMGIPALVMSDSTEHDLERYRLKEWIKKRIVRNFSACLVAGKLHDDYMQKLGMPADHIFNGYGVVDNDHFSSGAAHARSKPEELRARYNLPENYFIKPFYCQEKYRCRYSSVCRIPDKNRFPRLEARSPR